MNNQKKKKVLKIDWLVVVLISIILIGMTVFLTNTLKPKPIRLNYYELLEKMGIDPTKVGQQESNLTILDITGTNKIKSISYGPADNPYNMNDIYGTYEEGGKVKNFVVRLVNDNNVSKLERILQLGKDSHYKDVKTSIILKSNFNIWSILLNLLPIFLIGFLLFFVFKQISNQNSQAMDFSKNPSKMTTHKPVTFKDVAGADEEKLELEEIIDFLKNPKKYQEIGARIPKGVLLFGSPGTGKTLLAKAVAGEANVPFFSISGSEFVEMFVGVGASRVRNLFKAAKENAPCIIFIDEIDAVGRQRGAGLGGGHDEREQTLNQLLVEMDGFDTNVGIIIMAATNRPDVLDPALLRPGRFDRQITIDLPDIKARTAILKVHARNKNLDESVKLEDIAKRTPGFSGADIENLLNESALLAARRNSKVINTQDIDEGIDRVMMGPAKTSRKYNEKEKYIVSYHEAGHAVIGLKLKDANVVEKVTIIPRGTAGGYNLMLPKEETFFQTRIQLLDQITGFLGGRVAEELIFKSVTNGAHNDFEQATKIARAMVTEYGMSKLGTVQYEQTTGNVFLGRDYMKEKNFSDQVAAEIDNEIRDIMDTCYKDAKKIITENKKLLETIAFYLREVETLTREDIHEIHETLHLKRWDELNSRPEELEIKLPE